MATTKKSGGRKATGKSRPADQPAADVEVVAEPGQTSPEVIESARIAAENAHS